MLFGVCGLACCCSVFSLVVDCLLVVLCFFVACSLLLSACWLLYVSYLAFVVLLVVGRGSLFVDSSWWLFVVRCLLRVAYSRFVMFVWC